MRAVICLCAVCAAGIVSCRPSSGAAPAVRPAIARPITPSPAGEFLAKATVPWPEANGPFTIAVTSSKTGRVSIYDNALLALVLLRRGAREDAGRLLAAMAKLQNEDGSLPFSFVLPRPDPKELYLRSGAMAWVGYAAVEYLDRERGGSHRDIVVAMAHRVASYLLAHRVSATGDPRDGLITGGWGSYRFVIAPASLDVRQVFVPGEITWASVEHNIDAFFFLRTFARLTGDVRYGAAADGIAKALLNRGWNERAGQLHRGIGADGPDGTLALDCASWGALFLLAVGEKLRAETALAVADSRYASREPKSGARGHRPYSHVKIIEDKTLAEHLGGDAVSKEWDQFEAVWAEGSAGIALAAFRLGNRARADEILAQLDRLRGPKGGLPTLTAEVPYEFDTEEGIAGTAWVELVRAEMQNPGGQVFWIGR